MKCYIKSRNKKGVHDRCGGKGTVRITTKGGEIMLCKKMGKHLKKTAAICTLILLILAGCVLSTSAAVQTHTYTFSVSATGSTSFSFNADFEGSRTDTFGSYITVFNGKDYTTGTAYVTRYGKNYGRQSYNFSANSPSHPTLRFGTIPSGASVHYYNNTYGGFRSSVTTSNVN